jgi:hypothetical protein
MLGKEERRSTRPEKRENLKGGARDDSGRVGGDREVGNWEQSQTA